MTSRPQSSLSPRPSGGPSPDGVLRVECIGGGHADGHVKTYEDGERVEPVLVLTPTAGDALMRYIYRLTWDVEGRSWYVFDRAIPRA